MSRTDTVHARIRAARFYAGYESARQFALEHDYNDKTYQQWENGRRPASPETLEILAELFEVDVDWLKTGEGSFLVELNSTSKINNSAGLIDESLLLTVFNKLQKHKATKALSLTDITMAAAKIYNSVIKAQPSKKELQLVIDTAINMFLEFS